MEIHQLERGASEFQQPVDEQDLRTKLVRELPGEKVLGVVELKAGLFNNAYRVNTSNHAYILKVAPGRDADVFYHERYLMRRERSIARQLQSASPLVPEYLSFFTVGDRDAFLQPLIQGRLWHDVYSTLSEAENAVLWQQLGAFARSLHDVRGNAFGYPAPFEDFDRWSRFIVDNVEGMADDCRRLDVMCEEVEDYLRLLPHFAQRLDRVKEASLLHGDLWPRNVIIDGAGEDIHLKAVFDGERAFWGDPASDWVLILYGVPAAFWHGYGENLLEVHDPAGIAVYKGMYFIVNILEAVRSRHSGEAPRKWLSAVNAELEKYLHA